jgi:hypothetical protein
MKLKMNIGYEVDDTSPEVEHLVSEIVADEARGFASTIHRRLAAEGVKDISMSMEES